MTIHDRAVELLDKLGTYMSKENIQYTEEALQAAIDEVKKAKK